MALSKCLGWLNKKDLKFIEKHIKDKNLHHLYIENDNIYLDGALISPKPKTSYFEGVISEVRINGKPIKD